MQNIANLCGLNGEISLINMEIITIYLKKLFSVYKCLLLRRVNIYFELDQGRKRPAFIVNFGAVLLEISVC